jgi:integrase
VIISLTTGARQGEILNLEWRHVDFENKLAYLKETKNGRPRSISLSVAKAINANLTALYWRIGCRIRDEVLQKKRAKYGQEIVATLSRQLTAEYGQGFTEKGLRRMLQFELLELGNSGIHVA